MSDAKRTQFAVRAITLADTFNFAMAAERVRGPITYRVELSAPEGMSTAGGKQATQHVKLIPEGGGSLIVAGSANSAESWAEVRSFETLRKLHGERFGGADIPLDRVQYSALMVEMRNFFEEHQCTVRVATPPSPASSPRIPAATSTAADGSRLSGTIVMGMVFLAAAASAVGVVWFFTHR
jgi:hypothetical protein